jgi:hypothetical protein
MTGCGDDEGDLFRILANGVRGKGDDVVAGNFSNSYVQKGNAPWVFSPRRLSCQLGCSSLACAGV